MKLIRASRYTAAFCLTAVTAGAAPAATPAKARTAIKIDTIADKYELQRFSFELSPRTGNAEVRIEYDYPLARIAGDDTDHAPDPKVASVPGLHFDESARAIVYDDGAGRTTCATASRDNLRMKRTGACIVVTHRDKTGADSDTLDTWFEVRN